SIWIACEYDACSFVRRCRHDGRKSLRSSKLDITQPAPSLGVNITCHRASRSQHLRLRTECPYSIRYCVIHRSILIRFSRLKTNSPLNERPRGTHRKLTER